MGPIRQAEDVCPCGGGSGAGRPSGRPAPLPSAVPRVEPTCVFVVTKPNHGSTRLNGAEPLCGTPCHKTEIQLLTVDHLARGSMKNAAKCASACELQGTMSIDRSNAHGGRGQECRGPPRSRVGSNNHHAPRERRKERTNAGKELPSASLAGSLARLSACSTACSLAGLGSPRGPSRVRVTYVHYVRTRRVRRPPNQETKACVLGSRPTDEVASR